MSFTLQDLEVLGFLQERGKMAQYIHHLVWRLERNALRSIAIALQGVA